MLKESKIWFQPPLLSSTRRRGGKRVQNAFRKNSSHFYCDTHRDHCFTYLSSAWVRQSHRNPWRIADNVLVPCRPGAWHPGDCFRPPQNTCDYRHHYSRGIRPFLSISDYHRHSSICLPLMQLHKGRHFRAVVIGDDIVLTISADYPALVNWRSGKTMRSHSARTVEFCFTFLYYVC